jgi:hypothetical protein
MYFAFSIPWIYLDADVYAFNGEYGPTMNLLGVYGGVYGKDDFLITHAIFLNGDRGSGT